MFENLTNKFEEIFSSLKKAPSLDEAQVDEGLRGIRQALLEADVTLEVAKDFIENVKPKVLGQEIIRSTSPGDMVVKIVYDELVNLLGETNNEINLSAVPPVPMMLVGLQGAGKTTTTAKLAKYLEINKKKKVMMVSLDIYRPAAQEQLRSLGEQNNILTLPIIEGQQPTDICQRAISAANLNGAEVILFDTAGRTQIDLQMMSEIKQIENVINPTETFLVADSLTGQVAASVAKEFKNTVNLSGIILTRALVKIIPDKFTVFLNSFATDAATCPVSESATKKVSVGLITFSICLISLIICKSIWVLPAVSNKITSAPLRFAALIALWHISVGCCPSIIGSVKILFCSPRDLSCSWAAGL